MALVIKTKEAVRLERYIRSLVSKGVIQTWIVDDDGDYTPRNEKWRYHAWMSACVEGDKLVFGFVRSVRYPITNGLYAVVHGRLAATLLANFSDWIEELLITPQLDERYDRY